MIYKWLSFSIFALLLMLPLSGCKQEETTLPDTGVVEANDAYIKFFGSPPYETKGRAFARVGYLPLKKDLKQVRAIPLFLFTDQNQLQHIFNKLTNNALLLPTESDLYIPFPSGTKIAVKSLENELLTVEVTTNGPWEEADLIAVAYALTETAVQFPDVARVRIIADGRLLSFMPESGFVHDTQRVEDVPKPTLVSIIGMWDTGDDVLGELFIEFDRPITVNNFRLYDKTGKKVEGEYFTSAFQMAVVIHPDQPSQFKEGMLLQAEWDVSDTLGRTNKGKNTLPIKYVEH